MTSDEHNKTLGTLHLAYGGLGVLLFAIASFFARTILDIMWSEQGRQAPPDSLILLLVVSGLMISLACFLPALIAGYGLLKRKSWARTAGIISASLMALVFPVGTALTAYSFWFLFGGRGKRLYQDESAHFARFALGEAPSQPVSDWVANDGRREREPVSVTPAHPPDWR